MSKPEDICKHCHKMESAHCAFEAATMPPGCKCKPVAWVECVDIPPVCDRWVRRTPANAPCGEYDVCVMCEHAMACHKEITR